MNDLYVNGKYTVKKKNQKIVAKNNLTIFGAVQLARLFKKDVVFPKNSSNSFGRIISYNGQLKKIRIKDGSDFTYPTETQLTKAGMTWHQVTNDGDDLCRKYAIDETKTSSVTLNFNNSNNSCCYFDVNLKQALNISRIGILAKYNSGNSDQTNSQNRFYCNDLSFYLRPQGFYLSYTTSDNVTESNDITSRTSIKGSYIRVYNIHKQTINGKPYYIKGVYIQNSGTSSYSHEYRCLYYNGTSWVIGTISLTDLNDGDQDTVDNKFCPGSPLQLFSLNTNVLVDTNTSYNLVEIQKDNTTYTRTYYITLTKGVNKWIKPANRLHNYYTTFFDSSHSQIISQTRYMTLLGDTLSSYSRGDGNSSQINYDYSNDDFDSMLAYNCYSFEDLQSFKNLYNVIDDNITVDSCYENILGFAPYIDAIRFFRTSHDYQTSRNTSLTIYSIDIFSPCKTPYNPCKIALTQTDTFTDGNSWFVDSIQIKGNNTVVFSKQLQYNQGITYGNGFKKIGLFGNFNGHLNGTLPTDVKILDKNCFSKANFEYTWTKTSDQQILLTYEITIGDQE